MDKSYDIRNDEIDRLDNLLEDSFNKSLLDTNTSLDLRNLLSLTQLSWSVIRKNAKFIISHSNDSELPVNIWLESLRLLLEIDADLNFLYNSGEKLNDELGKFFYDAEDIWTKQDTVDFLDRVYSTDFSKNTKIGSTTFKRVQGLPYEKEENTKDYNLSCCCWCHFNALGLAMSENKNDVELIFGKILDQLRWYIVMFLHILSEQDYFLKLQQCAKQCRLELAQNFPDIEQLHKSLMEEKNEK